MSKGTVFFELFFRKSKLPWFSDKKLSRSQIVTINRCRANHYHLAASLNRIGIVEIPICKCGLANEDLNHELWQCTIYEEQRKKLVKKLSKLKILPPFNVESIITTPNIEACRVICSFFEECLLKIWKQC